MEGTFFPIILEFGGHSMKLMGNNFRKDEKEVVLHTVLI